MQGAARDHLLNLADAFCAETIACLKAAEFVTDAAMGQVIVGTGATALRQALLSCDHDLARHRVLSKEAKYQLINIFF